MFPLPVIAIVGLEYIFPLFIIDISVSDDMEKFFSSYIVENLKGWQ